ncbi:hypothetical protein D9K79_17045 [Acinetobacter cumulans]|uniref:Lipoprotein n=1 Tax=Acinetobacter cumulans TaxID=2136182 RepID=A0A498D8N5_9GAMM|nr:MULTISPECIES: hypothetical protein [Acinetobacter]MDV2484705.1 hypothetical protein [Acinetobacter towneri]RLL37519.1 hypothetical protein D9K79_17045 [Acinetobacter cumulans]RLL39217.1 hypothetical protein D9K80_00775 [Acinetobacter cumulans]
MKHYLKPILLAVTAAAGMILSGCSSSLDPNTFTVEMNVVDTSNWYAQNQAANVISIRSNSPDPINVTNVLINNGECSYEGYRRSLEYPQHFKMGLRLRLKLTGCGYDNVVRVDVETEKGTASYSFQ